MLLERQLDAEPDRQAAALERAAVDRLHRPRTAAGDHRAAGLGPRPAAPPGRPSMLIISYHEHCFRSKKFPTSRMRSVIKRAKCRELGDEASFMHCGTRDYQLVPENRWPVRLIMAALRNEMARAKGLLADSPKKGMPLKFWG